MGQNFVGLGDFPIESMLPMFELGNGPKMSSFCLT